MATDSFRSDLGFVEAHTAEEALGRTIEWERTHPAADSDPGPAEYAAEDAVIA
jgi:hypothetical protein